MRWGSLLVINKLANNWLFLSYQLRERMPAYGGGNALNSEPVKSIEKGDSCNSACWSFSNHLGTHIDFPLHFVNGGNSASDYSPDFWIFDSPFLAVLSSVNPDSVITPEDFDFNHISTDSDLIILKTGFCHLRKNDLYWKNNPGLSPALSSVLRKKFPKLKVIGIDSISVSSFAHRELGRKTHLAFLNHPRPILLLEDMNLSEVDEKTLIKRVIISPLRVEHADAAPCTVFAEVIQ